MIYVPDEHKYSIYYNDINVNIKIQKKNNKESWRILYNYLPHASEGSGSSGWVIDSSNNAIELECQVHVCIFYYSIIYVHTHESRYNYDGYECHVTNVINLVTYNPTCTLAEL